MKGIDVSKHQGKIEWRKVKGSGIDYAIIRAGYGKNTVDEFFEANINGCIRNNILVGIYWFIYGVNEKEAIENAEKCHSTIKKYKDKITMKVWCDLEYDTDYNAKKRGVSLTKATRTDMVIAFCERLKKYGYEVGNYANPDYLKTKFDTSALATYPLWLAGYSISEDTAKSYSPLMWQYTSKGRIDGIKGNVDVNLCYKEKKLSNSKNAVLEWQKLAILDGFEFLKHGADGKWGSECETVAKKAIIKKRITGYKYPNLTKVVQKAVGVTADGKCGKTTREAIIAYQKKHGLKADGCVGLDTWKKILGV